MCRRGLLSHLEAKVRRHGVLEKSCGRGIQTKTKSSIVALSNTANKTQGEKVRCDFSTKLRTFCSLR